MNAAARPVDDKAGQELQPGDRVRLSTGNRVAGYPAGEAGQVRWVSRGSPGGPVTFYHVEADRTGPARIVAFFPDEVEPER